MEHKVGITIPIFWGQGLLLPPWLPAKEMPHQHCGWRPHITPQVTALASASSLHNLTLSGDTCLVVNIPILFSPLHET